MPEHTDDMTGVLLAQDIVRMFDEHAVSDSVAITILLSTAVAYFMHKDRITVDDVDRFTDTLNTEMVDSLRGCSILKETSPGVYEFTPVRNWRDAE